MTHLYPKITYNLNGQERYLTSKVLFVELNAFHYKTYSNFPKCVHSHRIEIEISDSSFSFFTQNPLFILSYGLSNLERLHSNSKILHNLQIRIYVNGHFTFVSEDIHVFFFFQKKGKLIDKKTQNWRVYTRFTNSM